MFNLAKKYFKLKLPSEQPRKIAFLHIPKSAGSSVSIGLENLALANTAWGLFDESVFGAFSDYDSLHEITRGRLVHLPGAKINPEWDAVSGHLSLPTIKRLFPHHRIFTVLREPRTRLISHWLFWRALKEGERASWGSWAPRLALADGPLKTFIQAREIAPQTDNILVRMLLGRHPMIPLEGYIDPSSDTRLLLAARKALRSIGFIGLTEDKALDRKIGSFIGHPYELPRVNVTERHSGIRLDITEDFDAETMGSLLARCRLDRRLWLEAAAPLFDDVEAIEESTFLNAIFRHMRA